MILSFLDFISEEFGIDFEGNFTPLYHITGSLNKILDDDMLKFGQPSRGPRGLCFTRSKYYSHGGMTPTPRLILNRELLVMDGYRSYPIDEWILKSKPGGIESDTWVTERPWSDKSLIQRLKGKVHFGKSQFPNLQSGKRPIHHNIKKLPKDVRSGLEVEYEERILKEITNLGKYIYAINFKDEKQYEIYKIWVDKYLLKYPHIKILLGLHRFKEVTK